MDRRSVVELTNMCLIFDQDHILLEEKYWNGQKGYTLPGGHIEAGESLREAVIREMREETGLIIEKPIACGFKDWIEEDGIRYMVLLYKTNRFSGTLKSSDEGKVFWADRNEIPNLNMIWNFAEILQIMEQDDYSEFFSVFEDGGWKGKLL